MTAAPALEAGSVELDVRTAPTVGIYRVLSDAVGEVWVGGESTACPHLAITPQLQGNGAGGHRLTGRWVVTHVPTGKRVGPKDSSDVRQLRDFTRLVSDLDWSRADRAWWLEHGPERADALREAWDRATGS